ncbi:hypothetical protein JB92DRAFT_2824485 [Gautieria morchelliformis]|nr:hypothetical protein JB92DRAFT_2824485 [Gautieria morchelliformis]
MLALPHSHLYGIRAVARSPIYLILAGADKALVCWAWGTSANFVHWGQQTNIRVVEGGERIMSMTIDCAICIFSIGAGANNMLQCIWFPAHGTQMAPHISSVSNHNRSNILHDNKIQSREKSSVQEFAELQGDCEQGREN